jgi:valyl-tRNA synthetase
VADDDSSKTYDPHAIEQKLYEAWEQEGAFAPTGDGPAFCIAIPPPNVTGSLHMGHAFQDTIMDALIRYHRMKGDRTLWQAGTDHAGIATQMVVERQLNANGQTRHDLGREAFIEKVWQWKAESGGTITQQLRRMGASLDWSRERFTMDEDLSAAVREVFVRLYEEDLIYRGKRLVNWDPVLHTALSDLEVVSEEETGSLWHLRYPLQNGQGYVVVATTRPETMLGDTAVAVHPDDERYRDLVGQHIELPLSGRTIPIIADDYVDPEFGTGCLKITPAHDFNDYEVGARHQMEPINILDPNAAIDLPGSPYHGLDRFAARKAIVADLQAQGLIDRIVDHSLMVPRGDRTQAVVEPYLTDQWFVRAKPLADPAIQAVEDGRIRFVPENWTRTYFEWMHNIQDWCISRQIWWGHRIPAWYDEQGNIFVALDAEEAHRKAHQHHGKNVSLRQDDDVLDTWFSSALWPFSTLGWPQSTQTLKTFYPTNVLVTGFDIIFFWVARMIMFGLKFAGDVPFHEVYVHGLVRDSDGQKMSKSKGNVLDPLDLIDGIELDALVEKRTSGLMQPQMAKRIAEATRKQFPKGIPSFGTDALRFTFASLATQGRDIRFDLGRIEGFRNFCNKLWNAARFVEMNTEAVQQAKMPDTPSGAAERWIQTRLSEVCEATMESMRAYRFDQVVQTLHAFAWDEFCSWYLEIAKIQLSDPNVSSSEKEQVRHTLVATLESTLRLLHPLMPFITEALWLRLKERAATSGPSVIQQPYPQPDEYARDRSAVADIEWVKSVTGGVRNIRGEMNIDPRQMLPAVLQSDDREDQDRIGKYRQLLMSLARLETIDAVHTGVEPDGEHATALAGSLRILIPMGSLIDRDAELARLSKEVDKLTVDLDRCNAKLANPQFVDRAPADVVEKEKLRAEALSRDLDALRSRHERISRLA